MTIEIQLTKESINEAIRKVNEYKKSVPLRIDKMMQRLAEFGLQELNCNLASAEYDGIDATQTYIEWTQTGFNLVASGSTIAFIEFGTGVTNNPGGQRNYKGIVPPGVSDIGTYGHHLGSFSKWRYKGGPGTHGELITEGPHAGEYETEGNKPNAVLYGAGEAMRREVERIAREVFTSD